MASCVVDGLRYAGWGVAIPGTPAVTTRFLLPKLPIPLRWPSNHGYQTLDPARRPGSRRLSPGSAMEPGLRPDRTAEHDSTTQSSTPHCPKRPRALPRDRCSVGRQQPAGTEPGRRAAKPAVDPCAYRRAGGRHRPSRWRYRRAAADAVSAPSGSSGRSVPAVRAQWRAYL